MAESKFSLACLSLLFSQFLELLSELGGKLYIHGELVNAPTCWHDSVHLMSME